MNSTPHQSSGETELPHLAARVLLPTIVVCTYSVKTSSGSSRSLSAPNWAIYESAESVSCCPLTDVARWPKQSGINVSRHLFLRSCSFRRAEIFLNHQSTGSSELNALPRRKQAALEARMGLRQSPSTRSRALGNINPNAMSRRVVGHRAMCLNSGHAISVGN